MTTVLARWGNAKSRVHHLGIRVIRGLAAIGLTDLASGPPRALLRMIPRPVPSKGTDPSTWWRALTAAQGLDARAAMALRAVIDEAGPQGMQAVLAAYRDALQGPLDALKASREELFARILAKAQKAVGAAAFDPHKLPGGSPFVLFDAHIREVDRKLLDDAIRSGQGLDGFRQFEDAREHRLLADASERMAEMLANLWSMRGNRDGEAAPGAAPAGAEGSAPEDAGADAGEEAGGRVGDILGNIFTAGLYGAARAAARPEYGARRRRWRRWHDYEALEAFHNHPTLRQILQRGGTIDRTTLVRMRRRGEAGAPEAGFDEAGEGDAGEAGYLRPTPLYHLTFNRPMSRPEFGRLLGRVPQLRAHPQGVLREIAGLRSQARDVRGLNALTGEYHLLPGESYRDIAHKLVGDHRRWHELHFSNPARAENDPLVRVPPGWFGYIPYRIPAHRVHEHLRLREAAGIDDTGEDAGELDEAGFPRRRPRRALGRARQQRGMWQSQQPGMQGDGDPGGGGGGVDQGGEAEDDESSGLLDQILGIFGGGSPAPAPAITAEPPTEPPPPAEDLPFDTETPVRRDGPRKSTTRTTYTVQTAGEGMWRIAQKLGAASRPHWFGELRDANAHKKVAVDGAGKQLGWAHLDKGETVNVPDLWAARNAKDAGAWDAGEDAGQPSSPRRGVLSEDATVRTRPGGAGEVSHRLTAGWPVLAHEQQGAWCRVSFLVGPDGGPCDFSDRCSVQSGWTPRASVELTGADEAFGVDAEAGDDDAGDPTRRTYKVTAADVANPLALAAKAGVNPLDAAVQAEFKAANPGVDQPKVGDVVSVPNSWPERPGMYQTRASTAAGTKAPPASSAAPKAAAPKAGAPMVAAPSARAIDEDALRQNTTKRTYAVLPGEGMWEITKKLGAAGRPHWFGEMRDANAHKKILKDSATGKQLRFERLDPGKIINIPDVWPESQELRPPPGGEPTARPVQGIDLYPNLPGGVTPAPTAPPGTIPAAATVDPGTWGRVQAYLVEFRHAHPDDIDPRDYGAGMPLSLDTLGQPDARTKRALASFQVWANKMAGTTLRTDGILDPATISALDSFHLQLDGEPHQRPAVTQIPGATMPHPSAPYRPVLEGAPRIAGETAPPATEPRRPGTAPAPVPRPPAPRRPVDPSDPFAAVRGAAGELAQVVRGAAGELARVARDAAPPAGPAAPPRKPREPRNSGAPPVALPSEMARTYERLHPAPAPLEELPGVLAERGAPGTPSLPGGAPHRPPRASDARPPLQVTPDTYERLQHEGADPARVAGRGPEAPPPEPAPRPKKKADGDAAPIVGGALLGGLVGGPLGAAAGLVLGLLASEDPKPKGPPAPAQEKA